ncbi:MAG: hypothetical protein EOP35_06005 [Rubrivivax sp.]|nr:MAG: hypothetical protein EOP35_06005 [Rubrivivax sp.]
MSSIFSTLCNHLLATLMLAAAATASAPAFAAAPLMQDPPEIQRRVAALAEGVYPASACSWWGPGDAPAPGPLRIHAGAMTLGSLSQAMFAPGQEVGVGWQGGTRPDFNWEVRAPGDRMASIVRTEEGPTTGFIEIGRAPPGGRNIEEGWQCAALDLRAMPLLSPANPLRELMAELYDTGGREVAGACRNLGRKVNGKRVGGETRSARYSLSREAVVLNGKTLPLRQAERLDLGSRLDDGAINASFGWPDGSNFHVEQFAGSPLAVALFSFSEGEARWSCRPGR